VATLEGASTTTTAAGVPDAGEAGPEEALLGFMAGMREEGVDLPDPELDAEGNLKMVSFMAAAGAAMSGREDVESLRAAALSCREHLEGVARRFSSIDRAALEDRMLASAGCMREHGFDMPDPDFDSGSRRGNPFPGLSAEVFRDPAFLEANEACQGLFARLIPGDEASGGAG
jgi:hypothetical protein